MTHIHSDTAMTSVSVQHQHNPTTSFRDCGKGYTSHYHLVNDVLGNPHTHGLTLSFAAAALGSPNWWEHKHTISLVCASGGGAHTHAISSPVVADQCYAPLDTNHQHTHTLVDANGGVAHTHLLSSFTTLTNNADPAGTPANHTHTFTINTQYADNHTHTISGAIANVLCGLGYNHNHASATNSYINHAHSGNSGTSGSGGEGGAAVEAQMDGLVFVE